MSVRWWLCYALGVAYLLALATVASTDPQTPNHRDPLPERCARMGGRLVPDRELCQLPEGIRVP